MNILAIDTSTKAGSVAITNKDELIGEIYLNLNKTHSERILLTIDKLLNLTNFKLKDIDLFVCSIGPGSFTGIRIGLSIAKGFSLAYGKKLIGISSLDALAMNSHFEGDFVSIIEGRNNEIFYCNYNRNNGILKKTGEYSLISKDKIDPNQKIIFVGSNDLFKNNSLIEKGILLAHNYAFYAFKNQIPPTKEINPLYLKPSDAEINFKKKNLL